MSTLILVGGLLGLLLLGIPVAFALLLSSLALILYEGTLPVLIMAQRLSNALDSFPLLAIPLFILAAEIMNHSGATERIFRLTNTLLGRIPGGLGHVNVAASMLFSGMSGSAVADAARAWRYRDQGDEGTGVQLRLCRCRDRRLLDHRSDHPALGAHRAVRGHFRHRHR